MKIGKLQKQFICKNIVFVLNWNLAKQEWKTKTLNFTFDERFSKSKILINFKSKHEEQQRIMEWVWKSYRYVA